MSAVDTLTLLSGKPPSPLVDSHCIVALESAVTEVAFQRFIGPDATWDPSVQLHVLASLMELARRWLHEEVHRARQAGASWADIGRLLGVPAAVAKAQHTPPKQRPPSTRRRASNSRTPVEVLPFDIH